MHNAILSKLEQLCSAIGKLNFNDMDDIKFVVWLHETKFILILLSHKKEEKCIREELITMLEECVRAISVVLHEQEISKAKKELQGMIKFIIEMLKLRENFLDKENQQPKESSKK